MYTRGGIKCDKTDITHSVKGWSDEGIARFNALFDQVKKDRAGKPDFEMDWLEARHRAQAEDGVTPKKRKRQPTQARSELFESNNEDDISPIPNAEGPVEGSESDTDSKNDS